MVKVVEVLMEHIFDDLMTGKNSYIIQYNTKSKKEKINAVSFECKGNEASG